MALQSSVMAKLKAMKEQKEQAKKEVEEKNSWLRFKEGDTFRLRVVPDPDENQMSFRRYRLHYGTDPVHLCVATDASSPAYEQCPMCAFVQELKKDYNENKDLIYALRPVDRAVYRVLVRGKVVDGKLVPNKELTVKKFGCSSLWDDTGIHDQILAAMLDPEMGDITDLYSGRDFDVTRPKNGKYVMAFRPVTSALGSKAEIEAIQSIAFGMDLDADSEINVELTENQTDKLGALVEGILDGTVKVLLKGGREETGGGGQQTNNTAGSGAKKSTRRPDCFGNPDKYDEDSSWCQDCGFKSQCEKEVASLQPETESHTPEAITDNPLDTPPEDKGPLLKMKENADNTLAAMRAKVAAMKANK